MVTQLAAAMALVVSTDSDQQSNWYTTDAQAITQQLRDGLVFCAVTTAAYL